MKINRCIDGDSSRYKFKPSSTNIVCTLRYQLDFVLETKALIGDILWRFLQPLMMLKTLVDS